MTDFFFPYTDDQIAEAYLGDPQFFDDLLAQDVLSLYGTPTSPEPTHHVNDPTAGIRRPLKELVFDVQPHQPICSRVVFPDTPPLSPIVAPSLLCDESDYYPDYCTVFEPGDYGAKMERICSTDDDGYDTATTLPVPHPKPNARIVIDLTGDQTPRSPQLPNVVMVPDITITYIPNKVRRELTFKGAGPKMSSPGKRRSSRDRGAKFPALVHIEESDD